MNGAPAHLTQFQSEHALEPFQSASSSIARTGWYSPQRIGKKLSDHTENQRIFSMNAHLSFAPRIDCQIFPPRFTQHVQFEFFRKLAARLAHQQAWVADADVMPLVLVHNPRARRYILRVQPDGTTRVTIPRGGSAGAARQFAARHEDWLARARQRMAAKSKPPRQWLVGDTIMFRGESTVIATVTTATNFVRLGPEVIRVTDANTDLRREIEAHLRRLATQELPLRVQAHAAQHQLTVQRVTVRNQRSRWGSCSRRGTLSLNWRLIQTPPAVQDYIILHELMHLRQMNHSARFWAEVKSVCPDYQAAERWLKQNTSLLR